MSVFPIVPVVTAAQFWRSVRVGQHAAAFGACPFQTWVISFRPVITYPRTITHAAPHYHLRRLPAMNVLSFGQCSITRGCAAWTEPYAHFLDTRRRSAYSSGTSCSVNLSMA
jgi:hypothetical protein